MRKFGKASCFEQGRSKGAQREREREGEEEEEEEKEEEGKRSLYLFVHTGWQFASRVPRSAYDTMRNQ